MIKALLTTIAGLVGRGIAILALFFYAKKSGKDEQKSEQVKAQNDALQTRIDVEDDISRINPADKRRMLDKWASGLQRVGADTPDK